MASIAVGGTIAIIKEVKHKYEEYVQNNKSCFTLYHRVVALEEPLKSKLSTATRLYLDFLSLAYQDFNCITKRTLMELGSTR